MLIWDVVETFAYSQSAPKTGKHPTVIFKVYLVYSRSIQYRFVCYEFLKRSRSLLQNSGNFEKIISYYGNLMWSLMVEVLTLTVTCSTLSSEKGFLLLMVEVLTLTVTCSTLSSEKGLLSLMVEVLTATVVITCIIRVLIII